ncbi:MAG: phosphate-starvation-inducible PsiE family protein [Methylomicrobium sp.]
MLQLSYISTATRPMTTDDLTDILRVARARNADKGITGMLLYSNGTFVQVLEGEEDDLNALLEVIKHDSRHTALHVLEKKQIARREYPDWTMGFKRLGREDLAEVPGINKFFDEGYGEDEVGGKANLFAKLLSHIRQSEQKRLSHEELSLEDEDRFIVIMHKLIRYSVKLLAVLMVFTILWSVLDVVVVIYEKFLRHPFQDLDKEEILQVFGSFMLVLIAIEIFINITLYIRSHVIPVKLVVATALMAVARKIIVFDFHDVGAFHVFATGILVAALGGTYWLLEREFNPHAD